LKIYWDTSAAINAMISPEVDSRFDQDEHFTRLHTLSEFFSIMTGRGITVPDDSGRLFRISMSPHDAAKWLRGFVSKVRLVDLEGHEVLDALDRAEANGIQGGRVFDYGHALAARKASADTILTRNTNDFRALAGAIRIEWP